MSFQQHVPAPPPPPPGPTKQAWYKKAWVLALAAGFVGLILGVAAGGSADVTADPKYKSVVEEREDAEATLDKSNGQIDDLSGEVERLNGEVESIAGDLPSREEKLAADLEQLAADQDSLADLAGEVQRREKAVAKRERAVGLVEDEIAANTIPGDGIYEVGVDMKPGTYKSSGASSCYYAVLSSPNTNDIVNNDLGNGPKIVTVSEGQYFETSDCADWILSP